MFVPNRLVDLSVLKTLLRRSKQELIWRTKETEPGLNTVSELSTIPRNVIHGESTHARQELKTAPEMASRDTQGPFINTVSVGIYGPIALYKLAQWGALNKLWTRRRAPEIRYRGWPSTITRTCAHLFPLSSLDPTRHGQGQDCIRSVRDSTPDTFHLIRCISDYYLLIVSSQSMESKKLYI